MNPAWALLRLASPQLPIGGYSYSQGLEMAVEQARVHDPASARRCFEAPLLLAHCTAAAEADWQRLEQLAEDHRASRETRELYLSLQQLLAGLPELDPATRDFLVRQPEPHLALGWALAARAWRPGRLALELAGKPVGGTDEDPAARPAGCAAPDQ